MKYKCIGRVYKNNRIKYFELVSYKDKVIVSVPYKKVKEYLIKGNKIENLTLSSDNKILFKEEKTIKFDAVDMAKRLIVDSIWKSANLEGLGTTFPNTEAILSNARVNTTREEMLFVLNMRDAWKLLLNNLGYTNSLTIISQLNKEVGKGLFNSCGEVRNIPVRIGGTKWYPNIPIEAEVHAELDDLSKIKDKETYALKMFCYLVRKQIFVDGNKRVAQLMANKILIQNNIGIFQVDIDDQVEFTRLLISYYETNNDKEITKFMRNRCIKRVV